LCGIGVTSRIEVIVKPTACSARKRRLAARAGTGDFDFERAHAVLGGLLAGVLGGDLGGVGVDLREPLKPIMPADDQAMVLPCASVMVIIVLLNAGVHVRDAEVMFLRSRRGRAGVPVPLAIELSEGDSSLLLLLAGDRLGLALAGAGVGVGALAADRQALAVAQAAVAGEVHQPLDVHRGLAAQVALDL
jgi:hypothetical protein